MTLMNSFRNLKQLILCPRWIQGINKRQKINDVWHVQNWPKHQNKRTRPKLAGSCHIMGEGSGLPVSENF